MCTNSLKNIAEKVQSLLWNPFIYVSLCDSASIEDVKTFEYFLYCFFVFFNVGGLTSFDFVVCLFGIFKVYGVFGIVVRV